MSADPVGVEIDHETAPVEPPIPSNPLRRLVVPGLFAGLIICVVIYAVIPLWNTFCTADNNYQKIREDATKAYSRPYYPRTNPNGPFAPTNP
jgi:hypothetical protein